MKVEIPFKKHFREALLNGTKTWTSRTKKMGEVNDFFEAFGQTFLIMDIRKLPLEIVATFFYDVEGTRSKEEFIEIWNKIHPRKRFNPKQNVFVHIFRRWRFLEE